MLESKKKKSVILQKYILIALRGQLLSGKVLLKNKIKTCSATVSIIVN